ATRNLALVPGARHERTGPNYPEAVPAAEDRRCAAGAETGGGTGTATGRTRSAGARARDVAQSSRHLREGRAIPGPDQAQSRAALRRRRRSGRHGTEGDAFQEGRSGRRDLLTDVDRRTSQTRIP